MGPIRQSYNKLLNRPESTTTALQSRIDALQAELDAIQADLTAETMLRASETAALANNVAVISSTMGGDSATVAVLSNAFIDSSTTPSTIVARYGFNLDASNVVTSMQAIAQNAPGLPISQVQFNLDQQSENFVADVSGWRLAGAGNVEFQNGLLRGVFYGTINLNYTGTAVGLTLNGTHSLVKVTAPCTIALPDATTCPGRLYTISAAADNVVLDPSGAQTINGDATFTLYEDESLIVFSDGSNWRAA